MKNKKTILLTLLFLLISIPVLGAPKDIKGHWAEKNINWAIQQGIIKGYPDGTFKPDEAITKAEYYRITNQSEPVEVDTTIKVEETFSDIKQNDWFYTEVQKGITSGYLTQDGEPLRANDKIERQDAARIISYTQHWTEEIDGVYRFRDHQSIAQKYKGLVGAAATHNIVRGYPDGTLKPTSSLTRAEVVTMVKNLKANDAPPLKKDWQWKFTNSPKNFGKGYYIHGHDTSKAAKWFTPSDISIIRNRMRGQWGGSCFGFAYTAGLYAGNRFNVETLNTPSVRTIGEVKPQSNYNAQSAINIFQVSQCTRAYQDFLRYQSKRWASGQDVTEYAGFLKGYVQSHKNGAPPVQLAVYWEQSGRRLGHALVLYDMVDQGDQIILKVWDCNGLCKEVVLQKSSRTMVGKGLTTNASGSKRDVQITNSYAFQTLDFTNYLEQRGSEKVVYLSMKPNQTLSCTIDGKSYDLRNDTNAVYEMDGDTVIFTLPEGKNITITGQGALNIGLSESNRNTLFESDDFTKLTIQGDQVFVEGQKGNYQLSKTKNNPGNAFPWDTIEVIGRDAHTLQLKGTANGYTLEGENLKDSTVHGYKKFEAQEKIVDGGDQKIEIFNNKGKLDIRKNQDQKDKKEKYKEDYINPDKDDPFVGSWIGYDNFSDHNLRKDFRTENTMFIEKTTNGTYRVRNSLLFDDPNDKRYNGQRIVFLYEGLVFDADQNGIFLDRSKAKVLEHGPFMNLRAAHVLTQTENGVLYLRYTNREATFKKF